MPLGVRAVGVAALILVQLASAAAKPAVAVPDAGDGKASTAAERPLKGREGASEPSIFEQALGSAAPTPSQLAQAARERAALAGQRRASADAPLSWELFLMTILAVYALNYLHGYSSNRQLAGVWGLMVEEALGEAQFSCIGGGRSRCDKSGGGVAAARGAASSSSRAPAGAAAGRDGGGAVPKERGDAPNSPPPATSPSPPEGPSPEASSPPSPPTLTSTPVSPTADDGGARLEAGPDSGGADEAPRAAGPPDAHEPPAASPDSSDSSSSSSSDSSSPSPLAAKPAAAPRPAASPTLEKLAGWTVSSGRACWRVLVGADAADDSQIVMTPTTPHTFTLHASGRDGVEWLQATLQLVARQVCALGSDTRRPQNAPASPRAPPSAHAWPGFSPPLNLRPVPTGPRAPTDGRHSRVTSPFPHPPPQDVFYLAASMLLPVPDRLVIDVGLAADDDDNFCFAVLDGRRADKHYARDMHDLRALTSRVAPSELRGMPDHLRVYAELKEIAPLVLTREVLTTLHLHSSWFELLHVTDSRHPRWGLPPCARANRTLRLVVRLPPSACTEDGSVLARAAVRLALQLADRLSRIRLSAPLRERVKEGRARAELARIRQEGVSAARRHEIALQRKAERLAATRERGAAPLSREAQRKREEKEARREAKARVPRSRILKL